MKTLLTIWYLIAFLCSMGAAEMRVATVDLQRLLKEYYRAEEVAKQLEARHDGVFKELAQLRLDGDKLLKEAHDLQSRSLDLALTDAARAETKQSLELKLADLREFQLSYDQTRVQRESEFQNQVVLADRRIVDEVLTTTRGIGEKQGFNLVLNASKTNSGISDVVFAKNIEDITESVLVSLNATKPSSFQSPAAPGTTKKQ